MVVDQRGRVWEERVSQFGGSGDRSKVAGRYGQSEEPQKHKEGGHAGAGSEGGVNGAEGGLQALVEGVVRREEIGYVTRADVCVLAMHCLLSEGGFGNDELPSRSDGVPLSSP